MFESVLKVPLVMPILLLMSSDVPSRLPTYLHFNQLSSLFLEIEYFSVLELFILRFLSARCCVACASMSRSKWGPVEAQPMSSAYCWFIVK